MRRGLFLIRRLETSFLLGDLTRARALVAEAGESIAYERAFVLTVEHAFYGALTMAAAWARACPEERASLLRALDEHRRALEGWARNAPENFRHKHLLVEAERARLDGRGEDAAALYDRAIEGAAREGFGQDEALGNELCGRYHRALDRKRVAALYLTSALDGYSRWGARAKVEALREEFPELGAPRPGARNDARALDLVTLSRAAEAISSEVVQERLLEKLMEVCLVTGGAERGALLLEEDGRLMLRALGTASEPVSLERVDLEGCADQLPRAIIERASRADETVVLADASRPGHRGFEDEPYLASHTVRSVLALPLRRQGQKVGVLYLENNLATRVFTPDRVEVLQLLSSQIATSLQVSQLFGGLTHEIEERKRAEASGRFLADASVALAGSLDYRATLNAVARLAVGFLADWCVVDVFEEGTPRRVAAAHVDPEKEKLVHQLRERQDRRGAPMQALEMRTSGAAVLVPVSKDADMKRYVNDPESLRLAREIGVGPALILPMRARDRLLGTMTLVCSPHRRKYDERDLALGEELARRAAMALDNARLYDEARDAIRLRDDFLSIASHELNTPIAALQLSAEGFEQAAPHASTEVLQRMSRLMARQARRLGTLVKELMSVAELQAGRLHVERTTIDFTRVVREITEELAPELSRARCALTLRATASIEGEWDRTRLEQIVTNLLSNAMKYGAGKPITVEVSESPPGTARLVVADQGIGIDPDRLHHVFGRFERAVPVGSYGGLGLGLYVVREIVTALGGHVKVESVAGAGSTFTVELPLKDPGQRRS
jgi:signal transduction histidine kinase